MTKILDIAFADGRFYTLVDALRATGLDKALAESTPYTLLAPTDAAFAAFQAGGLEGLTRDLTSLTELLRKHIVSGAWLAEQLIAQSSIQSLGGQPLMLNSDGSDLSVENARVIMRDIEGDDGVMHVLDHVLA
ncbi:MAG: fasciclin domain-containing protein [Anaerolineae bacterium]|nr:fasciclin domain-containing protein [Anaerolineae bacterium]MCA9908006.1 fasciclin domain-containing protein [Anaerolineae bacterium]